MGCDGNRQVVHVVVSAGNDPGSLGDAGLGQCVGLGAVASESMVSIRCFRVDDGQVDTGCLQAVGEGMTKSPIAAQNPAAAGWAMDFRDGRFRQAGQQFD